MKTSGTMSNAVRSSTRPALRGFLLGAAIVYVLAWIIGLGISSAFPASDASGGTWINFLKSHQGLVVLQEYLIHGLAAIALVIFAAAVRSSLLRADADRFFPDLLLAGAVVAASVSLVQATVGQVVATKAAGTGDQALVQTMLALDNQADTFKLLALALLIAAGSVSLRQINAVGSWVSWGGIIAAVLLLLGSWSLPLNSAVLGIALDLSLLALLAWVLTVGIVLFRKQRSVVTAT